MRSVQSFRPRFSQTFFRSQRALRKIPLVQYQNWRVNLLFSLIFSKSNFSSFNVPLPVFSSPPCTSLLIANFATEYSWESVHQLFHEGTKHGPTGYEQVDYSVESWNNVVGDLNLPKGSYVDFFLFFFNCYVRLWRAGLLCSAPRWWKRWTLNETER